MAPPALFARQSRARDQQRQSMKVSQFVLRAPGLLRFRQLQSLQLFDRIR